MSSPQNDQADSFVRGILEAFDHINGSHPGFRPAHAKGILLEGSFTPAPGAQELTRAPHVLRESTPVSVRFSDSSGIPAIPDNNPNASPRGIAIRFHLAEHTHTDIIAHSVDAFPTHTPEEFLEFLQAATASGPDAAKPTPVEKFLGSHPAALAFVQMPKPVPASFATAIFFGVNAHKFTNAKGGSLFGRYRIRPEGAANYLDAAAEAAAGPNFLFEEIRERLAKSPVRMKVMVQTAAPGDVVNDATIHWPADRPEVPFGSVELTSIAKDEAAEQQHIIFDPIARVDGIEASDDPLLEARAAVYLASGRRRRSQKRTES
jgi:catalase